MNKYYRDETLCDKCTRKAVYFSSDRDKLCEEHYQKYRSLEIYLPKITPIDKLDRYRCENVY